jgi:hypothetical protein
MPSGGPGGRGAGVDLDRSEQASIARTEDRREEARTTDQACPVWMVDGEVRGTWFIITCNNLHSRVLQPLSLLFGIAVKLAAAHPRYHYIIHICIFYCHLPCMFGWEHDRCQDVLGLQFGPGQQINYIFN